MRAPGALRAQELVQYWSLSFAKRLVNRKHRSLTRLCISIHISIFHSFHGVTGHRCHRQDWSYLGISPVGSQENISFLGCCCYRGTPKHIDHWLWPSTPKPRAYLVLYVLVSQVGIKNQAPRGSIGNEAPRGIWTREGRNRGVVFVIYVGSYHGPGAASTPWYTQKSSASYISLPQVSSLVSFRASSVFPMGSGVWSLRRYTSWVAGTMSRLRRMVSQVSVYNGQRSTPHINCWGVSKFQSNIPPRGSVNIGKARHYVGAAHYIYVLCAYYYSSHVGSLSCLRYQKGTCNGIVNPCNWQ